MFEAGTGPYPQTDGEIHMDVELKPGIFICPETMNEDQGFLFFAHLLYIV